MPKINLVRKITVNTPVEKVFEIISDFNTWTAWSPWLIQEPGAKVTVADDSKSYEWEGKRVGAGNMTISGEQKNTSIDIDLVFLKPWKSKAKVHFDTKQVAEGTEISWHRDSSLPFFMFWMKKMFLTYIGMDYERGLRMLKDYSEDGTVHSTLNFVGNGNQEGFKYIGLKTDCTKETMAKKMQEDFPKLWAALDGKTDIVSGSGFTQYHVWDLVKNKIQYTIGIPVKEIPADLPIAFTSGSLPSTKIHTLEHVGPYRHLGNAWTTLYAMQRGKEFKMNKSVHPFETYHNKPGDVADNELITQIHFPIL
jgi:predicted transcriptional regulator YdeE